MADARHLLDTLHELRRQLDSTPDIDPEMRTRLAEAVEDIHVRLAASDAAEPADDAEATDESSWESVPDRLTEAVRHFEGSHPTLAGTLGSIIDALSRMGI